MSANITTELLECLLESSCLKKLALCNMTFNKISFGILKELSLTSFHLQDLDISWAQVSPSEMQDFLIELKDNRKLRNLNFSNV